LDERSGAPPQGQGTGGDRLPDQAEISLEQTKAARSAGLPERVVLMDAGYGNDTELRTAITALGMSYVAGIGANTSVWLPGVAPLHAGEDRPGCRTSLCRHHAGPSSPT